MKLCIPIEQVPTQPITKPEIKYEYIIVGVITLALLAYILKRR